LREALILLITEPESMRKSLLLPALCLLLALLVTPARAQVSVDLGPRIGLPLGDLSDADASLFIGADARITTPSLPVVLNPSFDFYFTDDPEGIDRSIFAVDLNALYEFGVENVAFTPYAGGGLAITRLSVDSEGVDTPFGPVGGGSVSDTEIGLNLIGGARFLLDPVQPFAQLNIAIGDLTRIGITGGVLFNLN
jgi:hypothetical protein